MYKYINKVKKLVKKLSRKLWVYAEFEVLTLVFIRRVYLECYAVWKGKLFLSSKYQV